ncbi:Shedu anti-phage system protein SduA domain-containing protein [Priestia megaterium]|uniref:Shedu anti-phage system protein SduA domain-containing protein n=1 Tax=Priestia megaterium TaxID=1404 RepID=UPI0037C8F5E1
MKLYSRDYNNLTEKELEEWNTLKESQASQRLGSMQVKENNYPNLPKTIRHHLSFFPNNYLDTLEPNNQEKLQVLLNQFSSLLNETSSTEQTMLNFIREKEAYFIIAALFDNYRFGHHDAYIFPEFQLGTDYRVDFLLVGEGSGGYQFIFVELEDPYKKIVLKDGNLGEAFRKGIIQISDWRRWLSSEFQSLSRTFEKYKSRNATLTKEFMRFDPSRCHFAVVAGRRSDFNKNKEKTYRISREHEHQGIKLFHYDNLIDFSKSVIRRRTY